nr:probable carbohydrate esterase At4g34215 [Ipomoea batatas]
MKSSILLPFFLLAFTGAVNACTKPKSIFILAVANEPLHQDIDTKKICGVGLGMCFANQVLRQGSSSLGVIGLVPCAVGGTSITQWSRGTPLYNSILERAAAAVRSSGKIEALLWYPGQFEALMGVGFFEEYVPKFFTSIRHDLHMPQLPIIQVSKPVFLGSCANKRMPPIPW